MSFNQLSDHREPKNDTETVALELSHVDAAYGPYRALFDISFEVRQGSIKALLGSNGSGKSTVARVISGLVCATRGTIRIDGTDATDRSAHCIARLGVAHVPEGRGIFASLTVEDNLTLIFRQRAGRRRVRDSLSRAYDAFPILKEKRHQRGGNLSGGQQRLLSLACVLIVPPKLLIADELSLGLAPIAVDAIYEGLKGIHAAGATLLIVEQQVDRVLEIADEALVLNCGSMAYDGPAREASAAIDRILASKGERHSVASSELRPSNTRKLAVASEPYATTLRNGHSHE